MNHFVLDTTKIVVNKIMPLLILVDSREIKKVSLGLYTYQLLVINGQSGEISD